MSIDLKADLIYSILAMDSYNRGYGFGITGLEDIGANARIGNFIIGQNVNQTSWLNSGFYAVSYRNASTNETVISYRGTDYTPFDGTLLGVVSPVRGGSDINNGYGLAFGSTQSAQGLLAARFYRDVTGVADDGSHAVNVTITGHSLGGGLAGYV